MADTNEPPPEINNDVNLAEVHGDSSDAELVASSSNSHLASSNDRSASSPSSRRFGGYDLDVLLADRQRSNDDAEELSARESDSSDAVRPSRSAGRRGLFGQPLMEADDSSSSAHSSDTSNAIEQEEDEDDDDTLLNYDPTPAVPYPSPKWFSVKQIQSREYGRSAAVGDPRKSKPHNSLPFDAFRFRKQAYNSLNFVQRMELTEKLEEHSGCVNCLNFNSSGELLASGSDDLQIVLWDWARGKIRTKYNSGHSSNVFQVKFCLDGHHIVSCARDGQVRLGHINNLNTLTNQLANNQSESDNTINPKKIGQHRAPAHKLALTSSKTLLSCGEDGMVLEIDLRLEKSSKLVLVKEQDKKVPLYSVNCSAAMNPFQFAVCGRSPVTHVYDRRFVSSTGGPCEPVLKLVPEKLKTSKHTVTAAVYNKSATHLLCTYNDEDIYLFNCKTGDQEHVYRGHRNSNTVKGCAWFGDDYVMSGSDDGYVYGWHKDSEHIVMSLYADENGVVNCIEPHPSLPVMATSGLDDNVKVWVPTSQQWPQTLKGIKQRICSNVRDRKIDHRRQGDGDDYDAVDASMIWLIIRQLRQRRGRGAPGPEEVEDEEEEDSDREDPQQCIQS